jgi:hypothetical protein
MTKSVQDQINDINALFPDNHRGLITPAALRSGLIEIVSNEVVATDGGTTVISGGSAYRFINANFAANSGDILYCDTSGGGFTITLPASPSSSFGVSFRDAAGSWGANNLTIDPLSNNIDGFPNTFSVDTSDANFDLVWVGGGTGWNLQFIVSPLVRKAAILRTGAGSAAGLASVLGRGLALAIAGAGNAAGVGTAAAASSAATTVNWNPSDKHADITLSGSNLIATKSGSSVTHAGVRGTLGHTMSHKYFEIKATASGANGVGFGISTASHTLANYLGSDETNGVGAFPNGYIEGPGVAGVFTGGFAVNDIIGIELLPDPVPPGGSLNVYKNGSLLWHFGAVPAGTLYPATSLGDTSDSVTANFGGSTFAFSPPSGASPWNTA